MPRRAIFYLFLTLKIRHPHEENIQIVIKNENNKSSWNSLKQKFSVINATKMRFLLKDIFPQNSEDFF